LSKEISKYKQSTPRSTN